MKFTNQAHKRNTVLSILTENPKKANELLIELGKLGFTWRGVKRCGLGGKGRTRRGKKIRTEVGRRRSFGNYLASLPEVVINSDNHNTHLYSKKVVT